MRLKRRILVCLFATEHKHDLFLAHLFSSHKVRLLASSLAFGILKRNISPKTEDAFYPRERRERVGVRDRDTPPTRWWRRGHPSSKAFSLSLFLPQTLAQTKTYYCSRMHINQHIVAELKNIGNIW